MTDKQIGVRDFIINNLSNDKIMVLDGVEHLYFDKTLLYNEYKDEPSTLDQLMSGIRNKDGLVYYTLRGKGKLSDTYVRP